MLREVDHKLVGDFFVEHALYYLDEAEMDALVERVEAWKHYEFCSAAPDMCIEPPDPKAPEALQAFIDQKREAVKQRTGFTDYYERDGIEALVVFLRPNDSSANLEFAAAVSARMEEQVGEVFARDGPWTGTGMTFNLTGPYVIKAAEQQIIGRDTVRSGLVALVAVIVILYLLFRSGRAVVTLLVPLSCGVAWSLAATQLTLGHLTAVTSLISSVMMGLGIDAGIHFLTLARREREQYDTEESIRRAFRSVIAPLLIASTTTVSAFLVMATSEFRGFREFGIIAAIGVALCLLAMVTVYPALLALTGIKQTSYQAPGRISRATRMLLAKPGLVFAALVALTLLSVQGVHEMKQDGFERNGRLLQSDETRADIEEDSLLIADIFGYDVHASVLAVDDWDELERIYALARKRHDKRIELEQTLVARLFAAPSVMPPETIDMAKRHEQIAALTEDWSPRTWARLEGKQPPPETDDWDAPAGEPTGDDDEWGELQPEQPVAEPPGTSPPSDAPPNNQEQPAISLTDGQLLRRMLEAKPFTPEDLPPEALHRLRGDDGSWGIFAHPNYDAADIYTGVAFMAETELYADGEGVFVGEPTVYATMYTMMNEEWPVIIGSAALLIACLVFWQVRSVGQTLITLIPLALAFWWTFGILGTFALKLNLFNVPILPAILGIGVDNGVYLTASIRRESTTKTGLHRSVDETGRAILAATMTTVAGFGAFLVADNGGLRSIGELAAIGILMTALAAMLAVPTFAALVQRRRDRLGGD